MTSRRIGLLGGTFDPIHIGHLDVAQAAQAALDLTRIHLITAGSPPHRPPPVASPFQRYAMVVLAVGKRAGWRASDMELRSDEPSYTSTTLARFHERGYRPIDLFFVIGADAFADVATWRDYPAILDAAHFAVVSRPECPVASLRDRLPALATRMALFDTAQGRPPFDVAGAAEPLIFLIDAPTADVSASAIRSKCEAGEPIDGLVPPIVQQYIQQHGLYTPKEPGRRASDAPPSASAGRLHGQD
jgi:nicotinate-nucleotide adenylyltransferase